VSYVKDIRAFLRLKGRTWGR